MIKKSGDCGLASILRMKIKLTIVIAKSLIYCGFKMPHNVGGMASKGLRAISCQATKTFEADYKPSHTTEALIGYTAC